ncbi:hypothetical protein P9112_004556 [Eukaryota sp. TZLM1-RC]
MTSFVTRLRPYRRRWFGDKPVWYWSPTTYLSSMSMLLVFTILIIVSLVAGSGGETYQSVIVVPKSTILLADAEQDQVESIKFDGDSNKGIVYKCKFEPPQFKEFTPFSFSPYLHIDDFNYEYFSIYLNRLSFFSFDYDFNNNLDFHLLFGKSELDNYLNKCHFDYLTYRLDSKSFHAKHNVEESGGLYFVFEDKDHGKGAEGRVNVDISLKTYNLDAPECQKECDLIDDNDCKIDLERDSDQVVILKGIGDSLREINFSKTYHPSNWTTSLFKISSILFILTAMFFSIVCFVGCKRTNFVKGVDTPLFHGSREEPNAPSMYTESETHSDKPPV